MSGDVKNAFELVKSEREKSVAVAIYEFQLFELETDASYIALAAVLNQNGIPVAFFPELFMGQK